MSSKTSRDKNVKEIKTTKFFSPSEFDESCSNDDSYYHEKQKEIFKNEVLVSMVCHIGNWKMQ